MYNRENECPPNKAITINCRIMVCLEEHLLEHGEEFLQRTEEARVTTRLKTQQKPASGAMTNLHNP